MENMQNLKVVRSDILKQEKVDSISFLVMQLFIFLQLHGKISIVKEI